MKSLLSWLTEHFDEIGKSLKTALPNEGCGLILEGDGYRWKMVPNTLNSPVAYAVDPREWMVAESQGEAVRVIVHSHVNSLAVLSERDVREATFEDAEGRICPLFPGVYYLVYAVIQGDYTSATLYAFDDELREFTRVHQWTATTDN